MRFYLGTDRAHWLAVAQVPLFVSHRVLRLRKAMPRAVAPWVLDSGGFTELSTQGRWTISHQEYVDAVRRYVSEIGMLDWCAPQDYMCEPWIIERTGLSIPEHQDRTITSVLALRDEGLPVAPVLQGWTLPDYERCIERYRDAGIDLTDEPIVGIGSVCRRQGTSEIEHLLVALSGYGIPMHGFGVKKQGVARYGYLLESADSMSWSFRARREGSPLMPGCTHANCSHCLRWALAWYQKVVTDSEQPQQMHLTQRMVSSDG